MNVKCYVIVKFLVPDCYELVYESRTLKTTVLPQERNPSVETVHCIKIRYAKYLLSFLYVS